MKLLHVIAEMDPKTGGVGQAVRTMVTSLNELGLLNEILCLDAPDAAFLANEKSIIHAMGPTKGPWRYSKKLSPWLSVNIFRFDVIIVHGLWLYNGFATLKSIKYLKRRQLKDPTDVTLPKLFVMPHGMLDPYFQQAPDRRVKALRNRMFWKLIENKLIEEADGLLFTCLTERKLACEPFRPYNPKSEFVVGLGIEEPPPFSNVMKEAFTERCPYLKDEPYCLFLSRIHEKKGIDILIKAYAKVCEKFNSILKLVIAGPGLETAYGKSMRQLVDELGIKENVHFIGMLSGAAKWGAFYGCEAFVLPSHQENFGIAVVEALACSKPVLISNQVNIWQEIENFNGGIIADDTLEGTYDLFTRWINMTLIERRIIQKNARTCFELNFAMEPAAKRLLHAIDLYSQPINIH